MTTPVTTCPQCARAGAAVDTMTIKALLACSLAAVTAPAYRFCPTPTCPVVYFAVGTPQHFATTDLREVVYQKAATQETTFVCYCFRYTVGDLALAGHHGTTHEVLATITAGIKAGACACDLRNPQGACCLGNVRAQLRAAPADAEAPTDGLCPCP